MGETKDLMKADKDREAFATLLSRYTKISKSKIMKALNAGTTVNDIIQNPQLVTNSQVQTQRIEDLKLLRNTYDNLKNYDKQYSIHSPKDAAKFFINYNMDRQDKEYLSIAYLNTKLDIIDVQTMEGALNYVYVSAREIVKEALKLNAHSLIISHNHPSGDPEASQEDKNLTIRLKKALKLVEMDLQDHIITADRKYVSLAGKGTVETIDVKSEKKEALATSTKESIKEKLVRVEKEKESRQHDSVKREKSKLER